jgi:hypothetical protein
MKNYTYCKIIFTLITIIVISFFLECVNCRVFENYDGPVIHYENDFNDEQRHDNGKVMSDKHNSQIKHIHNELYTKLDNDSEGYNSSNLHEKYKKVHDIFDIFTHDECKWIIYESEKYANIHGWTTERHKNYPTIDNDIENIEPLKNFVYNTVHTEIFPLYDKYYDIDSKKLGISEVFIVKYSTEKGMTELDYHEDGNEFSFIISLNDAFTGGGTHFLHTNEHKKPAIGNGAIFCGKNTHSGVTITSGIRYILAGFLKYGN